MAFILIETGKFSTTGDVEFTFVMGSWVSTTLKGVIESYLRDNLGARIKDIVELTCLEIDIATETSNEITLTKELVEDYINKIRYTSGTQVMAKKPCFVWEKGDQFLIDIVMGRTGLFLYGPNKLRVPLSSLKEPLEDLFEVIPKEN